jgi:hypothetical protein
MSRRTTQLFSLSLLDLLTSALGAIIFLFIITPKGGEPAAKVQQAMVYFDTTQMKIYGDLDDSLLTKSAGDTLFTVLVAYKDLPKPVKEPEKKYVYDEPRPKPQPTPIPENKPVNQPPKPTPTKQPTPQPTPPKKEEPPKKTEPTKEPPAQKPPEYKGDAPSVPCLVSFEVQWGSKTDNVDLFVCKGNSCVYGGNKKDNQIGQWDSGKSRNRVFGNDLRTNQEAVRQFDKLIPGEYKIYADFKESDTNRKTVQVIGLVYTKDESGLQRGEKFSQKLELGKGRTLLATVTIKQDGSYILK